MLASTVQFSRYGRAPLPAGACLASRGGSSGEDGPTCRCDRRIVGRIWAEARHDARALRTQQRAWHGVELQTPIRTETGFLGFAPPCGIAALCTGHCSMREAQDIRGMMI